MNKANNNIGVFFGSRSPEHDISIITGQLIISGLRGLGYEVVPVYLNKQGDWLLGEDLGKLKTFTDQKTSMETKRFTPYYLDLEKSVGKLVFQKKGFLGKPIQIDLAFPAFHGANGEDGTIQGLFEIFQVPYVGCDVTSSALTMDKILTKQFYEAAGISTTKFIYFDRSVWESSRNQLLADLTDKLKWPVIVKPARLGSSIGIAKVKTREALPDAIEIALHYGERVLVEESVENLVDITCAVLGNTDPKASLLQESVFEDELFSYDDKYLRDGGAQFGKAQNNLVIPARLDDKLTKEIQQAAVRIFKLFGCSGIARVDFLFDRGSGQCFANEVNTLPGTLYHHLWEKSGVSLDGLLQRLLQLAMERHEAKKRFASTFASSLLQKAGSLKLQLKTAGRDEKSK